jgi:hypothetical protein
MNEIIKNVWYGREKLWKVFWVYKVLIGGLLGIFFQILEDAKLELPSIAILAFYTIYHVWVLKGLYICRFNLENTTIIPKLVVPFVWVNAIFLVYSLVIILLKDFLPAA